MPTIFGGDNASRIVRKRGEHRHPMSALDKHLCRLADPHHRSALFRRIVGSNEKNVRHSLLSFSRRDAIFHVRLVKANFTGTFTSYQTIYTNPMYINGIYYSTFYAS